MILLHPNIVMVTSNICYYIHVYCFVFSFFQFVKANVQTFDIWYTNRTICVINGANNDNPKDLTCLNADDFNKSWIFPKPEITTHMNCRYTIDVP